MLDSLKDHPFLLGLLLTFAAISFIRFRGLGGSGRGK
jgi:hypothetical protein